ncbi:hypothetical protein [Saccharopolyspora hordei]|uniref:Uncharacterized protein n=1 Tax=Saccharopolyspora hordei TaxID=1838 RepID=A0A853AT85_9PSEU|nr:hypothetical protein [Saccharopolyspora hordei]NYI85857.1 hypothetical protein [Saccharopolyspora hordei]
MTGARVEPQGRQRERKSVGQRLWPVGIVADVAAVVTLLTGPTTALALVIAAVALLLGAVHLVSSYGKRVDQWVLVAVVGVVAGAAVITAIATQSLLAATSPTPPAQPPSPPAGTAAPAPSSAAATTSSAPTTSSSVPNGSITPPVRRETGDHPIVLTDGYALDLDSTDPLWPAEEALKSSDEDLVNYSGDLHARNDLAPATPDATYADCVRAGYVDTVESSSLRPGAAFCVKTDDGAYARVVVRSFRNSSDSAYRMELDITVWEQPG